MSELVCDTSVLQYMHQLDMLWITERISDGVIIPPAVEKEIGEGCKWGIDLPDIERLEWVKVRHPAGERDVRLITDMGPGEAEVLMLAIENSDTIAVLDDQLARKVARKLGLKFTGTLGLLLDAKKGGYIEEIRPLLDQLQALKFYINRATRGMILKKAGGKP